MITNLLQIKYEPIQSQPNTAAIIMCLRNRTLDIDLFKNWFDKELPNTSPNRDDVINTRVACAMRCRSILDKYFDDQSDTERATCIKYFARLISAKYSGKSQSYSSRLDPNYSSMELTLDKLGYAIHNKQPIVFLFCFGGYKNYRSPTYPEADWAEFFQLKFFIEYLLPIISDYKYGTLIQYESEDIIIERNYVPRNDLDKYAKSFSGLLSFMKKIVREQHSIELKIELVRCRDQYDNNKLFELMRQREEALLSRFDSLPEEERVKWLQRAEANIMWENVERVHELTEIERFNIIKKARIDNECFLAADYDLRGLDWEKNGGVDFFERPNCIPFVGTWGYMPSDSSTDSWFHLKSASTSSVDFWIGTGILSYNNGVYKERIVSPIQYNAIKERLVEESISISGLREISRNFYSIKIFNGKFPY